MRKLQQVLFGTRKVGQSVYNVNQNIRKLSVFLSTMHATPDVDATTAAKTTRVIGFYNENTLGVDCFDQLTCFGSTSSAF